ncbi:tetratricopeptide repeat protein [Desulfoplanes formicivorans]|uniref:Uncharacterized protein n=1 Tax=Desulfoplanes formicivorans TaxID=1592317 RepID=A0A194AHC1_9BACT|nr:tetratricopeptide repeat protein [Desulfoplanes formicivorans]GAU08728.1 hypothetical protein DPF_1444 [Desulfoplanes formicivorans]
MLGKREVLDQTIRSFVDQAGGFLLVSGDTTFVRIFKGLIKTLGMPKDCMYCETRATHYVRRMHTMLKRFHKLVLLVEASMGEVNNTMYFRQIKEALGEKVWIICLSSELNRDVLCLFHEMGADNIIIKPVSVNSIIKKIVYTIKPNNLRELVDKAAEAIAKGDTDAAQSHIDRIFEVNPESSIANILLGDMARKAKRYDEAEARYKQAASKARMYLEPLERLADLYAEINDREARIAVLERLDRLSPLNHQRKILIGDICADLGDAVRARKHFDAAVAVVRRHARDQIVATLMNVGQKVMAIDPELGIGYMNEAMTLKSDDFSIQDMWMFNEIGRHLRKQGKWKQAINYYVKALKVDPDNAGLFYNLAMAYLQGKMYFKALEHATMALDKNPDLLNVDISVPFNLARIYFHVRQMAESDKYVRMVLDRDPTHQGALKLLALLQGKGG